MTQPAIQPRRLAVAAAAATAPALAVLAGLWGLDLLPFAATLTAALAAGALAVLVVLPLVRDAAALAAAADDLALDEQATGVEAGRTPFGADVALALARARRRVAVTQRALENRAAGAESVLDGVPEPLLVLDRRPAAVHANLAAETLLGGGLVGRSLAEVLRNPDVLAGVDATLADGRARAVDFDLTAPVQRSMRARIAPLARWSETGEAIIVVLEDLTTVRRAEQMRVDFVANVSHELRTPLATLVGFIDTLQGPARDDQTARDRFLQIMQEQAAQMTRLVEDLLSLSRIELDEHNPPTGVVALEEVLGNIAESLELVAAERDMAIEVECPPGLPLVAGDRGQLTQVFRNLFENAVKYGRAGTPVRVVARPVDTEAGESRRRAVAVAVSDRGEGIAKVHLPRLTERFYRVDNARSRKLGGTGLGLAIVKHIVNRHRGSLAIESEVGQGSTFTVVLPAAGG